MSKAVSLDLSIRVLAAVERGAIRRQAADGFDVSIANVSRRRNRSRQFGDPRPKALGGGRRTGRIEARCGTILGLVTATPDITIQELRKTLAGRGVSFGYGDCNAFSSATGLSAIKDWRCLIAEPRGRPEDAPRLVRRPICSPSLTRLGPEPTWPAPTADVRAVSACAWECRTSDGR